MLPINVCGRQVNVATRDGEREVVYTEESPCQSFYDSQSALQVHEDCKTCWKRALSLDSNCPCARKNGVCELSTCVSAHPTQCRNTYAAMFQSFTADDLKHCERTSESYNHPDPNASPKWRLLVVIVLLLLPILVMFRYDR